MKESAVRMFEEDLNVLMERKRIVAPAPERIYPPIPPSPTYDLFVRDMGYEK